MALFGKKKTEDKKEVKETKKEVAVVETVAQNGALAEAKSDLSWVLEAPRLTEKAAIATSGNVYTFNVHKDANKIQVKQAIAALYKVTPIKVNMITNKPENTFSRGNRGTKKGFKKAMVYLKKGDKIELA